MSELALSTKLLGVQYTPVDGLCTDDCIHLMVRPDDSEICDKTKGSSQKWPGAFKGRMCYACTNYEKGE